MAAYDCVSHWLEANKDLPVGTVAEREVGSCTFEIDGIEISAVAQPFRFYLLQRLHKEFDSLSESDRADVRQLLRDCHMDEVLNLKLSREIGRANNLEVWV